MNTEFIEKQEVSKMGVFLLAIGVLQAIYYEDLDVYEAYLRLWHPVSWIVILFSVVYCIFSAEDIQTIIADSRKPKGDWKKVSIWKNR